MILDYRDQRTRAFAEGEFVRDFQGFARQAYRRLEALKGTRRGQFSIRINDQWRICFEWPRGKPGPSNVEIVDYH